MASTSIFKCAILFRINHFGINPVVGGSPPIDRTVDDRISMVVGDSNQIVPMSFIVFNDVVFMVMKIGVVVKI